MPSGNKLLLPEPMGIKSAKVQIVTWHWVGDKPLPEAVINQFYYAIWSLDHGGLKESERALWQKKKCLLWLYKNSWPSNLIICSIKVIIFQPPSSELFSNGHFVFNLQTSLSHTSHDQRPTLVWLATWWLKPWELRHKYLGKNEMRNEENCEKPRVSWVKMKQFFLWS